MSSINTLSHQTINLYADAARAIVGAYRNGTQRLLQGLDGRLESGLASERIAISAPLKQSLIGAECQITSLIQTGLHSVASVADQAIQAASNAATTSVNTIAAAGAQVLPSLPGDTAGVLATLNLPVAQLSHDVAARVAGTVRKVSARVAAVEAPVAAVAKTPRATASKRARAARKS
jgi:hypothetical protein